MVLSCAHAGSTLSNSWRIRPQDVPLRALLVSPTIAAYSAA